MRGAAEEDLQGTSKNFGEVMERNLRRMPDLLWAQRAWNSFLSQRASLLTGEKVTVLRVSRFHSSTIRHGIRTLSCALVLIQEICIVSFLVVCNELSCLFNPGPCVYILFRSEAMSSQKLRLPLSDFAFCPPVTEWSL